MTLDGREEKVYRKPLSSIVRHSDVETTAQLSGTDKGNPRGCCRLNPVKGASLTGTEGHAGYATIVMTVQGR